MKICIAGVGAVGGLQACTLAQNQMLSISLLARGKKAEVFAKEGVELFSDFYGSLCCRPEAIAEDGAALGVMDAVLVCVKNYSLAGIIDRIRPMVGKDTVLLPVMNGTEAPEILREAFPDSPVGEACIYTVSYMQPDFSIRQKGPYTYVYAGCGRKEDQRILDVLEELQYSALDLRIAEDIESQVWQKYILNCAFNTVTARYLTDSGHIRQNEAWKQDAKALLSEAAEVGVRSGVDLPKDIVEQKFAFMMNKQAEDATSSMRRDIEAHRPIELDAFSGAVIRRAERLGIEVPVTREYHAALLEMSAQS